MPFPTLRETDPDFIMRTDELQREIGLGIDGIVTGRKLMGIETPLLEDIAPEPTWEFTPAE